MIKELGTLLNEIVGRIEKVDKSTGNNKNKFAEFDGKSSKTNEKSIFDKKEENGINGQIDEPVYQGEYGDCWLLSGVLSMSYTESGSKVIKESINANEDGSVNVYFKGIDNEYTVSSGELAKENKPVDKKSNYSRGDDDALALELGVEKVVADPNVETKYSIQGGGNPYYLYQLYGAEKIGVANDKKEISEAFEYFKNNSENCSMTLGITAEDICNLKENHAYAVKEVTKSEVVIVDPWNSEKEINVNKENLLKESNNLSVVYSQFAIG